MDHQVDNVALAAGLGDSSVNGIDLALDQGAVVYIHRGRDLRSPGQPIKPLVVPERPRELIPQRLGQVRQH